MNAVTAYNSLTTSGRQFFKTYDRLNAATFVEYLKQFMYRYFGKITVMVDRAPPHRAKLVTDLSGDDKKIKIIHLPKG